MRREQVESKWIVWEEKMEEIKEEYRSPCYLGREE